MFAWIGKHAWTANLITYVVNIISPALPCTTLFALKRALYRLSGLSVGPGAKLGSCMSVYSNGEIIIGANVWLGRAANFNVPKGARVVIGDSCDIAPYVKFMCGSHLIGSSSRRAGACTARDISIGKGCWIGASVTVLGGAEVGHGTVIAAGSVVLPRRYPPDIVLAGVPARQVRELDV